MFKTLQENINKIENPFNFRIYINKNKVDLKYLHNIDFKNVEYIITPNLPNSVAFCIVDKEKFDYWSL